MRIAPLLRRLLGGALLSLAAVSAQAETIYITGAGLPTIRGGDPTIYKPIETAALPSSGSYGSGASARPIIPASSTPQMLGDVSGPWGPSSNQFAAQLSAAVFEAMNVERRQRGLRAVTPDYALAKAAGSHAADMISGDFFGHFTPDSRALKERLIQNSVPAYDEVAENLWEARGAIIWTTLDNRQRAIRDWLNSDKGHREALLDANLYTAGIGVAIRNERVVVALLLGRR